MFLLLMQALNHGFYFNGLLYRNLLLHLSNAVALNIPLPIILKYMYNASCDGFVFLHLCY